MFDELLTRSGLSLERLATFCQVAEAGGVARAAGGEPVRQSQYSRQIKELQEFFGVPLVRREGRGLVLTEAGAELHRRARAQLAALADFRAEMARRPVTLTVAAGESLLRWRLLPRLPAVSRRLPETRFRFLNLPTREAFARLRADTVDLAVVRADEEAKAFATRSLGELPFSWFVPRAWEARSARSFKALSALPLAVLEGRGRHREQLAALAERTGVALNFRLELPSFPLVAQAVRSGQYAGILPGIAREELGPDVARECRPAGFGALTRRMALVWSPRAAEIRPVISRAVAVLAETWRLE
jgi:DNA-binding transcriptional LysR family regulator